MEGENGKAKSDRWQGLKIAGFVISVAISIFMMYQTEKINHRLDVRDAYFTKGLIDGAKDREKAYFEMRTQYEQILNHCRVAQNGCNLPNELSVIPTERQFESLEAILTRK